MRCHILVKARPMALSLYLLLTLKTNELVPSRLPALRWKETTTPKMRWKRRERNKMDNNHPLISLENINVPSQITVLTNHPYWCRVASMSHFMYLSDITAIASHPTSPILIASQICVALLNATPQQICQPLPSSITCLAGPHPLSSALSCDRFFQIPSPGRKNYVSKQGSIVCDVNLTLPKKVGKHLWRWDLQGRSFSLKRMVLCLVGATGRGAS